MADQDPVPEACTDCVRPEPSETLTDAPGAAVPVTVTGIVEVGSATVVDEPGAGLVIVTAGAATTEKARVTGPDVTPAIVCVACAV